MSSIENSTLVFWKVHFIHLFFLVSVALLKFPQDSLCNEFLMTFIDLCMTLAEPEGKNGLFVPICSRSKALGWSRHPCPNADNLRASAHNAGRGITSYCVDDPFAAFVTMGAHFFTSRRFAF